MWGECVNKKNSFSISNEHSLVQQAKNGSEKAFAILADRYSPLIKHASSQWANCAEKEDLQQEGLLGFLSAIRSFNPKQGAFPAFAKTCVERRILTVVRKYKDIPEIISTDDIHEDIPGMEIGPDEIAANKEEAQTILQKLEEQLTPIEFRSLVDHCKGLTYKEIAEKLHTTPKAVDSAIQRARKKISPS